MDDGDWLHHNRTQQIWKTEIHYHLKLIKSHFVPFEGHANSLRNVRMKYPKSDYKEIKCVVKLLSQFYLTHNNLLLHFTSLHKYQLNLMTGKEMRIINWMWRPFKFRPLPFPVPFDQTFLSRFEHNGNRENFRQIHIFKNSLYDLLSLTSYEPKIR